MDDYERSARNWFVGFGLDRMAPQRADRRWVEETLGGPRAAILPVWRSRNLLAAAPAPRPVSLSLRALDDCLRGTDSLTFLGERSDGLFFAVDLPAEDASVPERLAEYGRFHDLRSVAPLLGREAGGLLAYARAMAYWHRHHRYCGCCGAPTRSDEGGHLRICTDRGCGRKQFPRTDPAVIVRVTRGEHCLVGRPSAWSKGLYSAIAGFVEPGESMEEAVAREVFEETGIAVDDIRYHSSQPWPFPSSLMLGFTARGASGDIRLVDSELEDARWLSCDDIRREVQEGVLELPFRVSIAYRLIEDWYDQACRDAGAEPLAELVRSR